MAGIETKALVDKCGICEAVVLERGILDCCGDLFCFTCIEDWATVTNLCPMCKRQFKFLTLVNLTVGAVQESAQEKPIQARKRDDSFSYFIDEEAISCLDGDKCKFRAGSTAQVEFEDTSVACDGCDRWYHACCVGFDPENPGGKTWLCPGCLTGSSSQSKGAESSGDGGNLAFTFTESGESAIVISLGGDEKQGQDDLSKSGAFTVTQQDVQVPDPPDDSNDSASEAEEETNLSDLLDDGKPVEVESYVPVTDTKTELERLVEKMQRSELYIQTDDGKDEGQEAAAVADIQASMEEVVNNEEACAELADAEAEAEVDADQKAEGNLGSDGYGSDDSIEELFRIVEDTRSSASAKTTATTSDGVKDNAEPEVHGGVRTRTIMRREADVEPEQRSLAETVRSQMIAAVGYGASDGIEPATVSDEQFLAAYKAAIARKEVPAKAKQAPALDSSRHNLKRKLYGGLRGRRVYDRDWDVSFWRDKVLGDKRRKTQQEDSKSDLLTKTQERSETIIQVADCSLLPIGDEYRPSKRPKASTSAPDNRAPTPKFQAGPSSSKPSPKPGSTKPGRVTDTPEDKRKWALELLAKKNNRPASNAQTATSGMANLVLLPLLPSEMRPAIEPNPRSKVPATVRQLYLNRFVEHFLKVIEVGNKEECQKAVDAATAKEKEVFGRSNSRNVYVNLCVRALAQPANFDALGQPSAADASAVNEALVAAGLADSPPGSPDVKDSKQQESEIARPEATGEALRLVTGTQGITALLQHLSKEVSQFDERVEVEAANKPGIPDPSTSKEPEASAPKEPEAATSQELEASDSEQPGASTKQPEASKEPGPSTPAVSTLKDEPSTSKPLDVKEHERAPKQTDAASTAKELRVSSTDTSDPFTRKESGSSAVRSKSDGRHTSDDLMGDGKFVELDSRIDRVRSNITRQLNETAGSCPADLVFPDERTPKDGPPPRGQSSRKLKPSGPHGCQQEITSKEQTERSKEHTAKKRMETNRYEEHRTRKPEQTSGSNDRQDRKHSEQRSKIQVPHNSRVENSSRERSKEHKQVETSSSKEKKQVEGSKNSKDHPAKKQVELYIKEHIRPLHRSGVIKSDQYQWTVAKTTSKVLEYHKDATSADFLIAEGGRVKKLAEQYLQRFTQENNKPGGLTKP